jgi:hypothetical protein
LREKTLRRCVVGLMTTSNALASSSVGAFSAKHDEHAQHPWYCTATPVHDRRTDDLIGILDVSGPAMTLRPAIHALVDSGRRSPKRRSTAATRGISSCCVSRPRRCSRAGRRGWTGAARRRPWLGGGQMRDHRRPAGRFAAGR